MKTVGFGGKGAQKLGYLDPNGPKVPGWNPRRLGRVSRETLRVFKDHQPMRGSYDDSAVVSLL